jgi:hypothetical protein
MKLLTKALMAKLVKNGLVCSDESLETKPVVKFFNPCGSATWLISEMMEDGDSMFGLCDLGHGIVEMGYVSFTELSEVKLMLGLGIERDLHFKATKTLVEYADDASAAGRITV